MAGGADVGGFAGNDAAIRLRCAQLAHHEGSGSEAPKLRWLARGYQAEARCRLGGRDRAQRDLDALAAELRSAQPDGGIIPREIAALRAACR